ncbi:MAG: hypothetical protein HY810_01480 [Candidatus Omnitrophica bacterium]|nr:hypothetical protein [Candidatus Omnitrophota bacterium]
METRLGLRFKARICYLIIALILLMAMPARAIESRDFEQVSEADLKYIFTSFQKVKVYYPVRNGGNIVTKLEKNTEENTAVHLIALFFSPDAAQRFIKNTSPEVSFSEFQVKETAVNNILEQQFLGRAKSADTSMDNPGFMIFDEWANKAFMTFEYLVKKGATEPYIIEYNGKKMIPAYVSQELAIAAQEQYKQKGVMVDRIGIDIRQFFRFIIDNGKKETFVYIYGY